MASIENEFGRNFGGDFRNEVEFVGNEIKMKKRRCVWVARVSCVEQLTSESVDSAADDGWTNKCRPTDRWESDYTHRKGKNRLLSCCSSCCQRFSTKSDTKETKKLIDDFLCWSRNCVLCSSEERKWSHEVDCKREDRDKKSKWKPFDIKFNWKMNRKTPRN